MDIQPLSRDEVAIALLAEPELVPVEGNASASGDDAFDQEIESSVLSRLQRGDIWAWATVTVTASWGVFSASDHLGCCSYAGEEDFCQPGGYFDDMVHEALDELNKTAQETYQRLRERELAS